MCQRANARVMPRSEKARSRKHRRRVTNAPLPGGRALWGKKRPTSICLRICFIFPCWFQQESISLLDMCSYFFQGSAPNGRPNGWHQLARPTGRPQFIELSLKRIPRFPYAVAARLFAQYAVSPRSQALDPAAGRAVGV